MKKLILIFGLGILVTLGLVSCTAKTDKNGSQTKEKSSENLTEKIPSQDKQSQKKLKKVDFLLDWTPNTNHTGLFVAKEKGFFAEYGLELDIKLLPDESTSALIINNKAPLGIYFQDSMANKLVKKAPITAIAAIIEHNSLGILSREDANIKRPRDLEGHSYGTWDDPLELATVKYLVKKDGGDFDKVKKVPNTDASSVPSLANAVFEAAPAYSAWDKVFADYPSENLSEEDSRNEQAKTSKTLANNFFYYRDFAKELDFYTPVIIANNTYLKENREEARNIIQAIKKGYQYTILHPTEALEILLKNAPEWEKKREVIKASQNKINKMYATNPARWGHIEPERWNAYYAWLYQNKIISEPITENQGFDNYFVD